MTEKTVVVAGGAGFIGSALSEFLAAKGWNVKILTRKPRNAMGTLHFTTWNPDAIMPAALPAGPSNPDQGRAIIAATALSKELEGTAAIVNLAGESIAASRWNDQVKRRLLDSRIHSTGAILEALRRIDKRPAALINASATGYYGPRGDETLDESSAPGSDFLADLCRRWEAKAQKAQELGLRVACVRTGIVLGTRGGALPRMLPPFKLGLGGPLGSGRQWMSWVHVQDLVRLISWIMEKPDISGALNGTAPNPATNEVFSKTLAQTLRRPCVVRAPAFALRLALGEMSAMLLDGQRVLPRAALAAGFKFQFTDLAPALNDLLAK